VYYAESFWGEWYDSLRGRACEFVATSDGETHCVPPGQVFYDQYFLDSECRQPLATVVKLEYAPEYIGRPPCPDGFMKQKLRESDTFAVHPVGAMVMPQTVYYESSSRPCGPTSPPEAEALFELQPELTYSDWVRAVEQIDEGTTRLRRQYLAGDDGSRSQVNWYDTQRKEPCRFRVAADGRYRCLPKLLRAPLTDARPNGVTAPTTVGYADDQCTIEVCQGGLCDDPKVQYIGRIQDSDDMNLRIFPRGAPSLATHERSEADPTCHRLPTPSPGIALGPEIPAAGFESAEIVDEVPAGRLRRKLLATPDGVTEPLSLYDTVLQLGCDFVPSEDGTWRCVPLHGQGGVAYTDAACSSPIMFVTPNQISAGAAIPRYASSIDPSTCPARVRMYEVGEKVEPPALYYQFGLGRKCTSGAPAAGDAAYTVTRRAPDDFELVSLQP
jgi:hypothetical protein